MINGDIIFETPGSTENSGQYVNSKVNINLSGEGSSWTGGIGKAYPSDLEGKDDYTAVTGFTLSLKDGATWNAVAADVSGFENGVTDAAIVANNVNLDNGVINVLDNHEVKIGSMGGSGGAINLVATTDDGQSIESGSVSIAETTSEMPVSVSLIGVTADDITNAEVKEERIIDCRHYHTIKECKNGEGPHPIKTPKGWLHLAHGVRGCASGLRYVLYMYMTSLEEPWREIATPGGYLMAPVGDEYVGDVMNVLFTNGWIADEDGKVYIYYASCDTRMHVATSTIDQLVDYCMNTPADGLSTGESVKTLNRLIDKNLKIIR